MNATKHENDCLRKLTELQADRIKVYEAVLREAGYDPETVASQSPAVAARAPSNSTGDSMQDKETVRDDDSALPTANMTRTRRGRAVRPAKR